MPEGKETTWRHFSFSNATYRVKAIAGPGSLDSAWSNVVTVANLAPPQRPTLKEGGTPSLSQFSCLIRSTRLIHYWPTLYSVQIKKLPDRLLAEELSEAHYRSRYRRQRETEDVGYTLLV